MFYYDDLAAAEEFYGTVLGLDKTQDFGWAKFFRVSAGAEVGIVKSGPGAYHTAQRNNAVMLSIVTTDVDAWYARLKAAKGVRFLVEISSGQVCADPQFHDRRSGRLHRRILPVAVRAPFTQT